MIEQMMFICEVCGLHSVSAERIKKCEGSHIIDTSSIVFNRAKVSFIFEDHEELPKNVYITNLETRQTVSYVEEQAGGE